MMTIGARWHRDALEEMFVEPNEPVLVDQQVRREPAESRRSM